MDMDIHEFNPICWVFYGFLIHLSWFFSSISNHKSSKILRKPPWGTDPRDLRALLLGLTMSTGPPEATPSTTTDGNPMAMAGWKLSMAGRTDSFGIWK